MSIVNRITVAEATKLCQASPKINAAMGSIVGALIGDASGSTVEMGMSNIAVNCFRSLVSPSNITALKVPTQVLFGFRNNPITSQNGHTNNTNNNNEPMAPNNNQHNNRFKSILTKYCGDWLDAEKGANECLQMIGYGPFNLRPGQVTDDGELTLTSLYSLHSMISTNNTNNNNDNNDNNNNNYSWNIATIANNYIDWLISGPFDIGTTTMKAIDNLIAARNNVYIKDINIDDEIANKLFVKAAIELNFQCNANSKANGALMRATPLAAYLHNEPFDMIAKLAKEDCMLTHPNFTCQLANACYVITISSLIKNSTNTSLSNKERRKKAYLDTITWFKANYDRKFANNNNNDNNHDDNINVEELSAYNEVASFFQRAESNAAVFATTNVGYLGHGFTMAYKHLLNGSNLNVALKETILAKGDTDTNACIVGGLIAAADGFTSIQQHQTTAIIEATPTLNNDDTNSNTNKRVGIDRSSLKYLDAAYTLSFVENVVNSASSSSSSSTTTTSSSPSSSIHLISELPEYLS